MKVNTLEDRVQHDDEIENSRHLGKISGTGFDFNSIAEAQKNNRGYFDLDKKSKCVIDAAQIIGGKYEQEDEILLTSITITNPEKYFNEVSQDCLASLQDFVQASKNSPSIGIETSNQAGTIDNSRIVNVPSESLLPQAASMRNEEIKNLGAADSELNQSPAN